MEPSLAAIERQGSKASESTTEEEWEKFHLPEKQRGRRILGSGRRICIVLEMRHLLGTLVEKAAWLLLE
jgi:hypothetical protein